jgi:hypothetical protein
MRGAGARACVAAAALALAGGCKGGEKNAEAAKQALAQSEDIAKQEDTLLARRDALVKARQRIRDERDKLDAQRREAIASGADTAAIDEQARGLLEEESGLADEEEKLNARFRDILRERRTVVEQLAGTGAGDPTAAVASREKSMAAREKDVADREAKLAEREAALARREAETCGVAAAPTTIIKTVDAKGSSYTKKDVEPLLAKARSYMSQKGLRRSDLPEPAQDLDKEATDAMASGDYGRARFAADQLVDTVKSVKIDKAFIQGKIARLNAQVKGKQLGGDADSLFREATEDYGDGKFANANKKLNKIYAMLE